MLVHTLDICNWKYFHLPDLLYSAVELINEGKMIYYINNTSKNKFLGTREHWYGPLLGTHNDLNYLSTNLWIREEVDNEDGFKLVHLESKKFLTATLNGLLALERGM